MQLALDIAPPRQMAIGGGLEGAERTSRETALWSSPIISPDRQINPIKDQADARGREMVQNDGNAVGALHAHKDSVIGSQFRLNAQPDYELLGATEAWADEFQRVVEAEFNLLSDSSEHWFDAARCQTLTEMLRLDVGCFLFTGEVLATVEWIREGNRPFKTAIQAISPARLSNPDGESDDRFLRRGIRHDARGQAEVYYIRMTHPNDFTNPEGMYKWKAVPARKPWGRRQVIHIIEPLQPDQTRGIADMVAVLKDMRMTKKFQAITLQNAVVNATYAAAIESELPKEMIYGAMGAGQNGMGAMLSEYMQALQAYLGGSENIAIDGVKMPHLFPGTKLQLNRAGTPGGVGTEFEASLQRRIASGLGLSYEEFTRDLNKANYSSLRAGMAKTAAHMAARKKIVADKKASMIYELWLEEKINAGTVPLPKGFTVDTYYNDPVKRAALQACNWIGASYGQIDEEKETKAAVARIQGGLSTLEEECARLGRDWRKVLRQLAREQKMMSTLKIKLGDPAKAAAEEAKAEKEGQRDGSDE